MQYMEAKLTREKVFEQSKDEFIEALIYHMMWSSDVCWKTIGAVTKVMNKIKYKKDKLGALGDNIQILYLGLGWDEFKTQWSKGGVTLSIANLTNRLKDIIRLKKKQVGCSRKS